MSSVVGPPRRRGRCSSSTSPCPATSSGASPSSPASPLLDLDDLRAWADRGSPGPRRRGRAGPGDRRRGGRALPRRRVGPAGGAARRRAARAGRGTCARPSSTASSAAGRARRPRAGGGRGPHPGLVAKLLHEPSVRLKDAAGTPRGERNAERPARPVRPAVTDAAGRDHRCGSPRGAARWRAGRPRSSPALLQAAHPGLRGRARPRRDDGRSPAGRPAPRHRRPGRVREGGPAGGARRPGRPRRALGQGPAVDAHRRAGPRRRPRAGRSARRARRLHARRPRRRARPWPPGSVRRRAQLAVLRPDLTFVELRGNIDTRLDKVPAGGAIVMAAAALEGLGLLDDVAAATPVELMAVDVMVPQVGQGAVAVECRASDDAATRDLLAAIEHGRPGRRSTASGRSWPSWGRAATCRSARTPSSSARASCACARSWPAPRASTRASTRARRTRPTRGRPRRPGSPARPSSAA